MEPRSSKSKFTLKVEKYPLPSSVEGIISLIREVMMQGAVQRFELDVDLPVRVVRLVAGGDPMGEEDIGLGGLLRQVAMVEYFSEGASQFQTVVDMLQLLHKEGKSPICWAIGPGGEDTLNSWMEWEERGMPSNSKQLLGIPVTVAQDVPSDVVILCGSEYPSAEINEITLAVKAVMEIGEADEHRNQSAREVNDRIRVGPGEHAPTAGQLAFAARGLRKVEWKPGG